MLAARTVAKEQIEYQQVGTPALQAGHALVRVHSVTLCGTDLHIWEDDYATELPIIQGHEFVGIVQETAGYDASIRTGDRVAVSPMFYCGRCYACNIGRVNACKEMSVYGCYQDGAFVELMSIPMEKLHKLPEALDIAVAPLHEPVSIAMQAVKRGRAVSGEKAVVLGCGPIGLLATLYMSDLGVEVIAADTVPGRAALAQQFGAKDILLIDPSAAFPDRSHAELLASWTQDQGPSLVIEATGVPDSLHNAIDMVATAGRVVSVGISDRDFSLPMRSLPVKEVDLIGSRNSQNLITEALELLTRHQTEGRTLITHRYPLSGLSQAFETMRSKTELVGKVAIDMPGAVS